ncbi:MAG: T9SS type A sorting domain-containing protein [Calditrichia bacterium]
MHGISDYLGLVVTAIAETPAPNYGQNVTLGQNYPNPVQLSAGTTLSTVFLYQLAQPQEIRLAIYDILGRRIAVVDEGYRSATTHRVFFDASDLPSGNYFYRLETPQGVQMNRFQVIR